MLTTKYLFKNRLGIYKIRIRIPKNLQEYFNRYEISKSLGTRCPKEAQVLSDTIVSRFNEIKRAYKLLDTEQIHKLVAKFTEEELEQDMIQRSKNGFGLVLAGTIDGEAPAISSAKTASHLATEYKEMLANANYSSVVSIADKLMKETALSWDKDSDNYQVLCNYLMRSQIELLEEAFERGYNNSYRTAEDINNKLGVIVKKATEEQTQSKPTVLISEAIERFLTFYKRGKGSKDKYNTCSTTLKKKLLPILKDVPVASLIDSDIFHLHDTIERLPNLNLKRYKHMKMDEILEIIELEEIPEEDRVSPRSVADYMMFIKQFFTYCKKNGLITLDLGGQVDTSKPASDKYPFSFSEAGELIKKIKELDINKQILLLPYFYTAFRRAELYNSTVEEDEGVIYFKVFEGKNPLAKRVVPIHSELLKLFSTQGATTAEEINQLMIKTKATISYDGLGKLFNNKLKKQIEAEDIDKKSLHSVRKTVITMLVFKNADELIRKWVSGHTPKGIDHKVYIGREARTLKMIQDTIELITY
jgi:integrase